jgi:hypothetical protein
MEIKIISSRTFSYLNEFLSRGTMIIIFWRMVMRRKRRRYIIAYTHVVQDQYCFAAFINQGYLKSSTQLADEEIVNTYAAAAAQELEIHYPISKMPLDLDSSFARRLYIYTGVAEIMFDLPLIKDFATQV